MESENQQPATQREAIAIIGMACLFPGAPDIDAYWRNILAGYDAVSDPPPGAWDPEVYYDPDSSETDRVYCKKGGYIEEFTRFDPLRHGIPPMAVGGEPDQWLALRIAQDAMIDAGYANADESVRHRTAVILGRGGTPNRGSLTAIQHGLMVTQTIELLKSLHPELSEDDVEHLRAQLKSSLPPFSSDVAPAMTPNVIVGRIANRLDLMGPNYTVDAACASSLIAIQQAIRELLAGECDLALAGGSQISTAIPMLGVFCQLGALSRTERIRPFDKDADGTLLGEGIGMIVLKRLSDAERDGDRIYAAIRGVGVASDGRAIGLMAPRVEGEELAIRRAYDAAGLSPDTVDLIEAHGTGTPVGDAVEIEALCRVFGYRDGELPRVALGSVKSMISHTMPAAGIAGVIKTALALYHKVLPPTLHCEEPNPALELDRTPFYINTTTRPWIAGKEHPRRAGVSAFGFGGINAHAVLEEHVAPVGSAATAAGHLPDWDSELFILAAESPALLAAQAKAVARYVRDATAGPSGQGELRLADVAYTLAVQADGKSDVAVSRLAVIASSPEDLAGKLEKAAGRLADPACEQIREASGIYYTARPLAREGKLALVFPGEGSQYTNMLADICLHFPEAREAFDRADRFHRGRNRSLMPSEYVFPRPTFSEDERQWMERQLWQMDGAVVSVLTADAALLAVLEKLGLQADGVAGHSSGEYAAFAAAGVAGDRDEARLQAFSDTLIGVQIESEVLDNIESTALIALGTDREQVDAMLASAGVDARVAMDNCPHQVVVAVAPADEEKLLAVCRQQAIIAERLAFDRPYHTPAFMPYSQRLLNSLSKLELSSPVVPLYSCATAARVGSGAEEMRELMAEQWSRPVEFSRLVKQMYSDGYRAFVEVGPRNNLTAFIEDILRDEQKLVVATNNQRRSGLAQLNHAIGQIVAHGFKLNAARLFEGRSPRLLDFEATSDDQGPSGAPMLLETGFPAMHLGGLSLASLAGRARSLTQDSQTPADMETPVTTTTNPDTAFGGSPLPPATPHSNGASPHPEPVSPSLPVAQMPQAVPDGGLADVAHHFLDTMNHFLQIQESVMRAYLGSHAPGVAGVPQQAMTAPVRRYEYSPAPVALPVNASPPPQVPVQPVSQNGHHAEPAPVTQLKPAEAPPTPVEEAPSPSISEPEALNPETLARILKDIVNERTGYPIEVIDMNADLEADLGIDSIKRVEILGTLRQQRPELVDVDLELLTTKRTLLQVVEVLLNTEVATTPNPL